MPVPVLVGSWNTIDGLVYSVRPQARDLIRAFWPGGLSLVVEQAPSLAWDLGDTRGTVMLRMPLHPVALELLRDVGPLAVSSANISGRPPANYRRGKPEISSADLPACISTGARPEHAVASTIVDLTGNSPRILRVGAVSAESIAEVLGTSPESLVEGVS